LIKVKQGDMFESGVQTLVNTVNCVGVMGKGIALEFKKRYPKMFRDYESRCKRGEVKLGRPYAFRVKQGTEDMFPDPETLEGPELILNFPTKDHWRSVSRLEDIIAGLEYLEHHYREWGVTSIAVPPLGCGHGQLEWKVVGRTLYRHLSRLNIPVEMYAPYGTPDGEMMPAFLAGQNGSIGNSRMEPAWIALAAIVSMIEKEPYHWPVGRTTFQKIAYFATTLGLPTGLDYHRGSYGPYAEGLKSVTARLMNNGILQERKSGRMFQLQLGPAYRDARNEYLFKLKQWRDIIEKVADLFLRLPSTGQAEIAATVHFAAQQLKHGLKRKPLEQEVLNEVMQWKIRRRPPIKAEDVAEGIRDLNTLGLIEVEPSEDLPLDEEQREYA